MPMLLIGILIGAVAVACSVFGLQIRPAMPSEVQMTYADMAAVMLGAVAVLVTVLGVFVAVLALWGYAQFKSTAQSSAIQHVKDELEDGRKLRILLRQRVDEILLSDAGVRDASSVKRENPSIPDEEFRG